VRPVANGLVFSVGDTAIPVQREHAEGMAREMSRVMVIDGEPTARSAAHGVEVALARQQSVVSLSEPQLRATYGWLSTATPPLPADLTRLKHGIAAALAIPARL
jgi:hypothetical protein